MNSTPRGRSVPHQARGGRGRVGPPRNAPVRVANARAEERHPWAIAALLVPLVFCAIVGVGVFLMFHRQMAFFKPAPSGSAAAPPALAAGLPSRARNSSRHS